jgi:hypothetical protein
LAWKKVAIEKKCKYNLETAEFVLAWYGKIYKGKSCEEISNQIPLIKNYKKDISLLSNADENDTLIKEVA